ncbi:MAG: hypothetical protein DMF84_30295 [Acidobacteria bacterium]|nr:MAG: hypothetical protein DMF84_30295 [Acidobacteriota bacterium]
MRCVVAHQGGTRAWHRAPARAGTVFAGDEKLTTALLDRLAHHATVITTKGKSYRMRKRRGGGS